MDCAPPEPSEPLQEDWDLLVSFLPSNWEELARETGALRKLRKDKSPSNLLRTLLLHLGCGHSLRETVVRARKARLSDVALLKRLRKSRDWLRSLCVELFRERGLATAGAEGRQIRAFDATTVKEPGQRLEALEHEFHLPPGAVPLQHLGGRPVPFRHRAEQDDVLRQIQGGRLGLAPLAGRLLADPGLSQADGLLGLAQRADPAGHGHAPAGQRLWRHGTDNPGSCNGFMHATRSKALPKGSARTKAPLFTRTVTWPPASAT